jgi:hypothetical protein
MTKKTFSVGQEITAEDCSFGLGSIYLAGPGQNWKDEFIKKIDCDCTILNDSSYPRIPSQYQTNNIKFLPYTQIYQWESMAMSMASLIVFWFPENEVCEKSLVDFGIWANSERVFLGIENKKGDSYLAHLLYQNHRLYPAETLDQLVEMVTHWLNE